MTQTPPSTSGCVDVHLDDADTLWVTLQRPESANARNQAMRDDLMRVWTWCGGADGPAVVVLTGAGSRHFCAGMDLKEATRSEGTYARRERMRASRDIELLAALPQPTIAAVNGAAMGGGLEMALACDLRIVAGTARVGLPEVGHGLMPGGGATFRLPRLVGAPRALELMWLGTIMDADEAVAEGIADRRVPVEDLEDSARRLAHAIAGRDRAAVRAIKEAVRFGSSHDDAAAADREADGLQWLLTRKTDA